MKRKIIPGNLLKSLGQTDADLKESEPLLLYNKNLLVSTEQGKGGLYCVEPKTEKFKKIHEGYFVGLVRHKQGYLVLKVPNKLCVLDFDLGMKAEIELDRFNMGLHGLAISDDGFIYIVDAQKDRVLIYDQQSMTREMELVISEEQNDCHHINDIYLTKESLYLSMFSLEGGYRKRGIEAWDGAVVRLDRKKLASIEVVVDNLKAPHSIMLFGNWLYFCDSLRLNVARKNIKSGDSEIVADFHGFTRGLSLDQKFLLVGQSKMRHIQRLNRQIKNISLNAGVHLYNQEHRVSRFINLPVENIYSVIPIKG